jgi:hypothetical protein
VAGPATATSIKNFKMDPLDSRQDDSAAENAVILAKARIHVKDELKMDAGVRQHDGRWRAPTHAGIH